jgi:hypothetical protein
MQGFAVLRKLKFRFRMNPKSRFIEPLEGPNHQFVLVDEDRKTLRCLTLQILKFLTWTSIRILTPINH